MTRHCPRFQDHILIGVIERGQCLSKLDHPIQRRLDGYEILIVSLTESPHLKETLVSAALSAIYIHIAEKNIFSYREILK